MIAIQTRISPTTLAAFKSAMRSALGTILAALLGACLAWWVTASTNAQMAIQQQDTAIVNQFDETGANLDSSMSAFIDALVEGDISPDVRKSLRTAISLHAAKAQRLNNIVGERAVQEYTKGLGLLRTMADSTDNVQSGMAAAQVHADILANKKRISDSAWKRIENR